MYYQAIPHNKYVTIQGQFDEVYRGPTDAVFIIVIDLDRGGMSSNHICKNLMSRLQWQGSDSDNT